MGVAAALLGLATGLLAAGCGESGQDAPPTSTELGRSSVPVKTRTARTPGVVRTGVIRIELKNHVPSRGIETFTVKWRSRVHIIVESDSRDLIRMLGYTIDRPARRGHPAHLTFRADQLGRFQVESLTIVYASMRDGRPRDPSIGWLNVR